MDIHPIHQLPDESLKKKSLAQTKEILDSVQKSESILREIQGKEFPKKMSVSLEGVSVVSIKGEKGEKGDTPTDEHLIGLILPLIPEPIPGKDGYSPTEEDVLELIRPLIPEVKDGETPTDERLLSLIRPLIPAPIQGERGNDGSPDTPDEIVDKVNQSGKKIQSKQVDGLLTVIRKIEQQEKNPSGGGGGNNIRIKDGGTVVSEHVTEIDFGANISASYSENGKIEVVGSAGSGGIARSISVTSGSATMGSSANTDYVYFIAGAHTMSLPAASGNTNRYTVKNNHSTNITIDTVGAETIEGSASISIAPGESVDIISDGSNWLVV